MEKCEKMNKLLIILIAIVIFIAGSMVAGFMMTGFTSELNNYTGNGVSFKYPADYNITEVNDNSTFLMGKNTKNPSQTFQISKSPVNGDKYHGMNLDEYYNTLVNDFKSRGWFTMVHNTTIDGSQAYSIDYLEKMQPNENSINGYLYIFDKNGTRYTIDIQGKGKQLNDLATTQIIISFKVL